MKDSLLGSQVAGYRIERVLGRGGMASVYFAWDTRQNRPVALKVMDERYRDTPSYVDRFIQEAQAIASWDQPNIVKVWDAGEEGGIYYYAMEYIRGLDLSQLLHQYLDAGQLMPYTDVVRLGWAVATALDFAHYRGIIHRDVKPSNVLISVDGRVLLSDFGLVMDISRGTMGETFGSPAYIAPEQARSSAQAVPQSDLYSLGVMLYEMLTGTVPFHDASPAALALKHLSEEPPRPRALNPRLNQAVEAVLLRALRKRPAERYATGREMMTALERAFGPELQSNEASIPLPISSGTIQMQAARDPLPAIEDDYSPVTEVRSEAPNPPNGPQDETPAYPAGNSSFRPVVVPGEPRVFSTDDANSAPPPGAWAVGAAGAGGAPPPGGSLPRRRGFGLGCLAGLLAVGLMAILLGVALAANFPGRPLFHFPWSAPLPISGDDPQATETVFIPPTLTVTPTRPTPTLKPSATKRPPKPTATATRTKAPTRTAVP